MKRNGLLAFVMVGVAVLAYRGPTASAQSGPSLGMAQSFAILGGTSVVVASTGSAIAGDVGVSPGTSITGFPVGGVIQPPFSAHANDAAASNAQASTAALYSFLQGMPGATPLGPELGSTAVAPGVYSFATTANIAAGTVFTLSGAGTYIFKVGSSITANVGSSMSLLGGASPCNVFWQVNNAATINGAGFAGTVVAQDAVTLGSGARLDGRALTTASGSVTLAGGNVVGGCSTPANGCPTTTLSPSTLPNGTVGVAYSQAIVGSGGSAPYTFAVTAGALPAGLVLNPAGVLTGTPTVAGPATFTITAMDGNGCPASIAYTMTIAPPPPPVCPVITLAPLATPNGGVAVAYSQTLVASGGLAPYSYGATAGTLPAGVTLSAGGVLSGTPTTAGTYSFTVRATDANGCFVSVAYSIVIAAAPPPPPVCPVITLAPLATPNGGVAVAYSQTLVASGGLAPYSYGTTAGTLPAGVTLSAGGVLSGTPTTAGTYSFTVRATDANGCFVSVAYSIVIAAAPPPPPVCPVIALAPLATPNGGVAVAYSQTLVASGGLAPYSYGTTAGTLPAGVTLSAGGVLSGTPTTAGTYSFTVRATDANGCFASVAYSIVIAAAPPPPPVCPVITLAPLVPPNGAVAVAYSQDLVASGGLAPYSYGTTAGTLPAGLTLSAGGLLSGTPTTAGTYSFTIRATDANGCFVSVAYSIIMAPVGVPPPVCPVITFSPATLPDAVLGVPYSQDLTGSGGTAPYTFTGAGGAFPAGLGLTTPTVVAGTPTTAGSSTFTLRATDANGCFAERSLTVLTATAVPTLPQAFFVVLALGLTGVGYLRLRRRALG